MGALGVVEFVTLDGVMQGFHDPDDHEGGFQHGGWGAAYADQTSYDAGVEGQAAAGAYLVGRRTYEHLAAFWPHQPDDNPMAAHLNGVPKYVATRTMSEFSWNNTQRLDGDLRDAVVDLKARTDGNIAVLGSGQLVGQLLAHDLVDELHVFVHPLVLGSGARLFPALEQPMRLRLEHAAPTSTGVLMLRYTTQR